MHNWYNANFDVLLVQCLKRIFQIKFWFYRRRKCNWWSVKLSLIPLWACTQEVHKNLQLDARVKRCEISNPWRQDRGGIRKICETYTVRNLRYNIRNLHGVSSAKQHLWRLWSVSQPSRIASERSSDSTDISWISSLELNRIKTRTWMCQLFS